MGRMVISCCSSITGFFLRVLLLLRSSHSFCYLLKLGIIVCSHLPSGREIERKGGEVCLSIITGESKEFKISALTMTASRTRDGKDSCDITCSGTISPSRAAAGKYQLQPWMLHDKEPDMIIPGHWQWQRVLVRAMGTTRQKHPSTVFYPYPTNRLQVASQQAVQWDVWAVGDLNLILSGGPRSSATSRVR